MDRCCVPWHVNFHEQYYSSASRRAFAPSPDLRKSRSEMDDKHLSERGPARAGSPMAMNEHRWHEDVVC
jgi:hypothetical protein